MSYSYKPLRIRSAVRLIKILPSKVDDKVVCILDQFDQAEAPPYCALSYVWGDPTPAGFIYLGEHSSTIYLHHLHKNLLEFLRCMWEQRMFDKFFWTDSLCLNQTDKSEKAQQVPHMAEIYVNAEEVICWLGHEYAIEEKMKIVQDWHPIVDWDTLDTEQNVRRDPTYEKKWNRVLEAANCLLCLPYWTRVWIVQEFALSRKALIACGSASLDIDTFREKINELRHKFRFELTIWSLCELRDRKRKTPLWRLVCDFHLAESSLTVDRVYGFIGLLEESEREIWIEDDVNYQKTIPEVFWDAIFKCCAPWSRYSDVFYYMGSMVRDEQTGTLQKHLLDLGDYIQSHWTSDRHIMFAEIVLRVFEAARIFVMESKRKYREWHDDICGFISKARSPIGEHPELQDAAVIGLLLSTWMEEVESSRISHWRNQETFDPSWKWQRTKRKDGGVRPFAMSGRNLKSDIGIKLITPVPETISQSYLAETEEPINFHIKGSPFHLAATLDVEHSLSKFWVISLDTFIETRP